MIATAELETIQYHHTGIAAQADTPRAAAGSVMQRTYAPMTPLRTIQPDVAQALLAFKAIEDSRINGPRAGMHYEVPASASEPVAPESQTAQVAETKPVTSGDIVGFLGADTAKYFQEPDPLFDPRGPGSAEYLAYLKERRQKEILVFDSRTYRSALLADARRMRTFRTPHTLPTEPDWGEVGAAKRWLKDANKGRNIPPRPVRTVKA
jgi:hypothetical protein